MTGSETLGLIAAPFAGAVFGGLLGYIRAKKLNPLEPFKVWALLETVATGGIAGLLWLGAVEWGDIVFSIPILIMGFFAGAGLDFTAKKTVIP